MQSFLGKRVVRELKVLRHIPERKVYELRVEWESDASPATFFLSELPRTDKPFMPIAVDPTLDSNATPHSQNETNSLTSNQQEVCKIPEDSDGGKKILNFDKFIEPMCIQLQMAARKREIVAHRQSIEAKKRRKAMI